MESSRTQKIKRERRTALLSYVVILLLLFVSHIFRVGSIRYFLPMLFVMTPLLSGMKVRFSLNARSLFEAVVITIAFLAPVYFLFLFLGGRPAAMPVASAIVFHLIVAAIPEEVYFRGYLQEVVGNNYRGVVIVSFLFAFMHAPRFFSGGDYSALLTFFPSLVMGWLYLKKRNLLYPVIFHYFSNLLFISFF